MKRILAGILMLASLGSGQRKVDPKNTYARIICVVPIVGNGSNNDPKRPQYVHGHRLPRCRHAAGTPYCRPPSR
jgi:hypothetical protein